MTAVGSGLRRHARLFGLYFSQYAKARLEYRADFFSAVIASFLGTAASFAFLLIVFSRVPAVRGWKFEEMVFLYGFSLIPVGIFNVFVISQFWALANDLYDKEQGKRLLPVVGIGSSLGAERMACQNVCRSVTEGGGIPRGADVCSKCRKKSRGRAGSESDQRGSMRRTGRRSTARGGCFCCRRPGRR